MQWPNPGDMGQPLIPRILVAGILGTLVWASPARVRTSSGEPQTGLRLYYGFWASPVLAREALIRALPGAHIGGETPRFNHYTRESGVWGPAGEAQNRPIWAPPEARYWSSNCWI